MPRRQSVASDMAIQAQYRSSSYRQLLEDFIVMYRNEPCLWHVKNKDYYDRTKRNAALDRLLEKCKELEPTAVRDDVSKKINSLRTTYNKERVKVMQAEQAGVEHVPKLWYYGLMNFLHDKDNPVLTPGGRQEPDAEGTEEVNLKEEYVNTEDGEFAVEDILSIEQSNDEDPILTDQPKRRKRKVEIEYNDPEQSDDSHIEASTSNSRCNERRTMPSADDRHDFFGKYISCKLRELPKKQLLLAEKLINEVLFEAECCKLTMTHRLTK